MRLNEDIRARAFHGAGEIYLQFGIVAALECWDAQHRSGIVTRANYGRDLFTDRIAEGNHCQARRHSAAKIDMRTFVVSRQGVFW